MAPSRIDDHADTAAPPSKTAGTIIDGSSKSNASSNKKFFGNMNTSMIESKFLSHPDELGIVAVGFSGGQVCAILCS